MLSRKHVPFFIIVVVVKAQKMEQSVGHQQRDFVSETVFPACGMFGSHFRANDNVTQKTLGRCVLGSRAQFIHGKTHNVSWSVEAHPFMVERAHRVIIDKDNGQFGFRMDVEPVIEMLAEQDDPLNINFVFGFVEYFDCHVVLPVPITARPLGAAGFWLLSIIRIHDFRHQTVPNNI